MPANAGIQEITILTLNSLDSRVRGNDDGYEGSSCGRAKYNRSAGVSNRLVYGCDAKNHLCHPKNYSLKSFRLLG